MTVMVKLHVDEDKLRMETDIEETWLAVMNQIGTLNDVGIHVIDVKEVE